MKKTLAVAALAATAGLATAGLSVTVDVSGAESWDFLGDPDNTVLQVLLGANATVTGISWDVNLTTIGLSWADEHTWTFEGGAAQVNPGAGDAFTVVNMNYQGSTSTSFQVGADGLLDIELHEVGFDDNPNAVDSFLEAGSSLTINYVPAPGALAVLGLGGLVAGRRRR